MVYLLTWDELNALHWLAENDIIIRDVTDKIHQIPVHENNEFMASSNKSEHFFIWRQADQNSWLLKMTCWIIIKFKKKKKKKILIIFFFLYHSTLFTVFFKPQYVFGFISVSQYPFVHFFHISVIHLPYPFFHIPITICPFLNFWLHLSVF
jgi:hypothetical protein